MEQSEYQTFLSSSFGQWLEQNLPVLADGSPDLEKENSDAVHTVISEIAERIAQLKTERSFYSSKLELNSKRRKLDLSFLGDKKNRYLQLNIDIAVCERLMELIVYRLYGLNNEEVTWIEKNLNPEGNLQLSGTE